MEMNVPNALAKIVTEPAASQKEQMKIVIVGHVDHGKSTLIGRLFYETRSLPDGKFEELQAQCVKRGMPFEYSFLLDALQAERDQGITIDTTQIWFQTKQRNYVIIDAPGHTEFLKNMISGAASSDAAVLVIDAKEGVKEQSKRHGYLLHLLGISQLVVVVNKMDLVGYDEATFRQIERDYTAYLHSIGVKPRFVIPVSGREGDSIVVSSGNMRWYQGPTLVDALDAFTMPATVEALPLRFPIQDVYKFDERRIIAGRIESGTLKTGDEILISPSQKRVKVASIETWGGPAPLEVSAGMSVGITLSEQLFIERGQVISHTHNEPLQGNLLTSKLFWLADTPLTVGARYTMKIATAEYSAEVRHILHVVDTADLGEHSANHVPKNAVGEVVFKIRGLAAVDAFTNNPAMGRFVLVDNYRIVGGGILSGENLMQASHDVKSTFLTPVNDSISPQARWLHHGHTGGVLWFSGLSGAGKTTIAKALEQTLFAKGFEVFVLDGDNIRGGLCSDLGFSLRDRAENLRRVGEVAALFAEAGVIVITAFISPLKAERDAARLAAKGNFHSIFVKADIETCAQRDPKGLYAKAKRGEIQDFTGISSPFEAPENPDMVLDTTHISVEHAVEQLMQYVEEHFVQPVKQLGTARGNFVGGEI
jgi:bifunctional enzyme CysN/CysC